MARLRIEEHTGTKLKFHSIHGRNIDRKQRGSRAVRTRSFGDGVCFSNRPIAIDEVVGIRQTEVCDDWSGVIRVGLTSVDPITIGSVILPKYVFPEWSEKPGYWIRTVPDRYAKEGFLLQFSLSRLGVVSYSVNGKTKGIFIEDVDTTRPLWVIVDVYGKAKAVEFVDFESPDLSTSPTRGTRQVQFAEQPELSVAREFGSRLRVASPPARSPPVHHVRVFTPGAGRNPAENSSSLPARHATSFSRPPSARALSIFGSWLGRGATSDEARVAPPPQSTSTSEGRQGRLPPAPRIPAPETPVARPRAFVSRFDATRESSHGALSGFAESRWARETASSATTTARRSPDTNSPAATVTSSSSEGRQGRLPPAPRLTRSRPFSSFDPSADDHPTSSFTQRHNERTAESAASSSSTAQPGPNLAIGGRSSPASAALLTTAVDSPGVLDELEEMMLHGGYSRGRSARTAAAEPRTEAGRAALRRVRALVDSQISTSSTLARPSLPSSGQMASSSRELQTTSSPSSSSSNARNPRGVTFNDQLQTTSSSSLTARNPRGDTFNDQTTLSSWSPPTGSRPLAFPSALARHSPPSTSQTASTMRETQSAPSSSCRDDDCCICMEAPVNAVMYTCGHMCACFECAVKIKREGYGCPICRKPMRDVIRTYKS